MIDRDDCTSLSDALGVDLDSWIGEGSVDIVDWDRVVWVGSTTLQIYSRVKR
jgi:hypothetical protein